MLSIAGIALALTPKDLVPEGTVLLESMVPREFGDWIEQQSGVNQVPTEIERRIARGSERPLYDQVLMRTYRRRSDGATIMLALAYGRRQVQEYKIHRPELCYYSQGFEVTDAGSRDIMLDPQRHVALHQLLTRNRARAEPVTYWIRVGDRISPDAWETRWILFKDGIEGYVPDGILVRASSLIDRDSDVQHALQLQGAFLADLYSSLSPQGRATIAGG
jgi:EpsI family protein